MRIPRRATKEKFKATGRSIDTAAGAAGDGTSDGIGQKRKLEGEGEQRVTRPKTIL